MNPGTTPQILFSPRFPSKRTANFACFWDYTWRDPVVCGFASVAPRLKRSPSLQRERTLQVVVLARAPVIPPPPPPPLRVLGRRRALRHHHAESGVSRPSRVLLGLAHDENRRTQAKERRIPAPGAALNGPSVVTRQLRGVPCPGRTEGRSLADQGLVQIRNMSTDNPAHRSGPHRTLAQLLAS